MKKFLMAALMCLMVSSTCLANGVSGVFSVEESIGDRLVDTLSGKGNYATVEPLLSNRLHQQFRPENFNTIRKTLNDSFGKIGRFELVAFNRVNDVNTGKNMLDNLGYILHSANGRHMLLRISLVNENGIYRIDNFDLNEVAPQNTNAQRPAK